MVSNGNSNGDGVIMEWVVDQFDDGNDNGNHIFVLCTILSIAFAIHFV